MVWFSVCSKMIILLPVGFAIFSTESGFFLIIAFFLLFRIMLFSTACAYSYFIDEVLEGVLQSFSLKLHFILILYGLIRFILWLNHLNRCNWLWWHFSVALKFHLGVVLWVWIHDCRVDKLHVRDFSRHLLIWRYFVSVIVLSCIGTFRLGNFLCWINDSIAVIRLRIATCVEIL